MTTHSSILAWRIPMDRQSMGILYSPCLVHGVAKSRTWLSNYTHSLEELMVKLKLQHFGHLVWIANSIDKTLILGKIEDRKRRGQQRMRWLDGIIDSMDMKLGKPWKWWRTGKPGLLSSIGSQRVRHDWATEQQVPTPRVRRVTEGSVMSQLDWAPWCPGIWLSIIS